MIVEIARTRGTTTERMHLRPRQTIEAVKLHRRERRAQGGEFGRRCVQFAALVVGADDEHAHVVLGGGFDGGPVEVVHEVPVDIEIIKGIAAHGFENDVGGGVGGEADVAHAAFALKLPRRFDAAAFAQAPVQQLPVVDAVHREQVHVVQLQKAHGFIERVDEFARGGEGRDLRLHDQLFARQFGQHPAQLHLAGAIAARSFNVVDAQLECAMDRGLQIRLTVGGHFPGIDVLPLVLIAHAAAGDHGHLQFSAAKSSVLHHEKGGGLNKLQFRQARQKSSGVGLTEETADGLAAAIAIVERPVIDIHAHKSVGQFMAHVARIL